MAKEHFFYKGKIFKEHSKVLRKPNKHIYLDCASYLFAATYRLDMFIDEVPVTRVSKRKTVHSLFFQKCTFSLPDIKDLEVVTLFKYDNIFTFLESFKERTKKLGIGLEDEITNPNSIFAERTHNLFTEGEYGISKLFDKDEPVIEFFRMLPVCFKNHTMATDVYICSEYLFNNLFNESP